MAVSFRGGGPKIFVGTGNPISGTLTGAWQPQAGDLLYIEYGNDYYGIGAMPTPSVGGSTTGVTAVTNGSSDAGTPDAHVKTFLYDVVSTGDLAVSATESAPGDEDKILTVWVLTGAAAVASQPDGGSAGAAGSHSAGSAQSSFVFTGVTPSSATGFLIYGMNSGGGSSAGPPFGNPAGTTEAYDAATGGISYTGGYQQLAASGATGTRTVTAGAGSVTWAGVLITIAAAGGGSVAAAITFGAAPTLTAAGFVTEFPAVSFGAAPTLTAAGTRVQLPSVTFGAAPTLAAAGTIVKLGAVTFGAAPVLTAAGLPVAVAAVVFDTAPTLSLAGLAQRFATVAFGVAPQLLASAGTGPIVPYVTAVLTPGALADAMLTPGAAPASTLTPGSAATATLTPGGL